MSITLYFILSFAPVVLAGFLLLRWFQLAFLYNTVERYFTDIGPTLGVAFVFIIITSIFVYIKLKPYNKTNFFRRGKSYFRRKKTMSKNSKRYHKIYDISLLSWILR